MECPRCQAANREDRRFCGSCGAPLAAPCESCGFTNDAGMRFCGGCGAPLGAAATSPASRGAGPGSGERRQVTVLFADVVGFTPLSERFDPEVVHEIMEGCIAVVSREVDRYGGFVNAFTGDGVMALFGAPRAEEDHAVRALLAALAIQEALPSYGTRVEASFGVEFRMRIGSTPGSPSSEAWGTATPSSTPPSETRSTWPPASSQPPRRAGSWPGSRPTGRRAMPSTGRWSVP